MILFECTSRGQSKRSWLFSGVFFALSLLGLLVMNIKPESGILSQAIFLFCLMAAVYVLVRYVTNAYLYRVVDEGEDGIFFLAVRLYGKKMLTQCKLPISALTVIAKADIPLPPKTPVSNFSPVLMGEEDTLLHFPSERILLRVSLDEAFVRSLRALVPNAAAAFTVKDAPATESSPKRHGPYDLSDIEAEGKNQSENNDGTT